MDLTILVAFIFLVDLEVQRGGVVEDYVHAQIEQIVHLVEDGLLDGFLSLSAGSGAVELMQLQCLALSM